MELAIPLIALGSMYIVSNQSSNNSDGSQKRRLEKGIKNIEGYQNLNNTKILPNTTTPPQNYPITDLEQLKDTVQKYENPNTITDRYFNQGLYENSVNSGVNVGNTIQDVYSLTGNYLSSEQFKHGNMQPFNSGKI